MQRITQTYVLRSLRCALAACLIWGISASVALAQWPKLPKVPKLPGQKQTKTQQKTGPAPVITALDPDSGPPGAAGQVTLTGKNFTQDLRMAFNCDQVQVNNKSFKVQSAERASVYVSIPLNSREGSCVIQLVRYPGAGPEETNEKLPSGTPEVFAVPDNSPHFAVSSSGKLPVSFGMLLLGEGEMDFMDIQMKRAQELQSGFGPNKLKTGQIMLMPDSIKYVQDDKEVFSATPATVKSVDEMTMMGQPTGIFRIVLTNGKIYNFGGSSTDAQNTGPAIKLIKKRLGK